MGEKSLMTEHPENMSESHERSTDNTEQRPQFEVIRSPDFKMVYVNNVSFHATAFDVHLTFGELYRDASGKEVLEQRVIIGFSPQTAKVLAALMNNGVANYEAQIGEVKLPPGMMSTSQESSPTAGEPSA